MVTALPVMALYPDLVPDVPAASLLLEIRDNGLSQTILAGEKCLIGRKPASGGDEKTLYMGHDDVITRSVRNAILATRTLKHFQDTDLSLVNPWGLSGSI